MDKYDDAARYRVSFGQRIGPDEDACWPESNRSYSGTVYCDLVSIGGLHWDTGDVKVADSHQVSIGSGYLCLLDEDGAPWCWEWSQQVQPPRPTRVPQDSMFQRLVGGSGFACAQRPDEVTVTCWTVAADGSRYRQTTHRVRDGSQWVMKRAGDDPPRFTLHEREGGRLVSFHPFTGEKTSGVSAGTRLLVTETVP